MTIWPCAKHRNSLSFRSAVTKVSSPAEDTAGLWMEDRLLLSTWLGSWNSSFGNSNIMIATFDGHYPFINCLNFRQFIDLGDLSIEAD